MSKEEHAELYNEIMWGRTGRFPWWPCLVLDSKKLITKYKKLSKNGSKAVVMWFGDQTFSAIDWKAMHKFGEGSDHHSEHATQDLKTEEKERLEFAIEDAELEMEEKSADRLAEVLHKFLKLNAAEKERYEEWKEVKILAHCDVCNSTDDPDTMLLCDALYCNRSYHMKCINLDVVPDGEWICDRCKSGLSKKQLEAKKKVKEKRKPQRKKPEKVLKKPIQKKRVAVESEAKGVKKERVLGIIKNIVTGILAQPMDYDKYPEVTLYDAATTSSSAVKKTLKGKDKKKVKKKKRHLKLKRVMDSSESESEDSDDGSSSDEEADPVQRVIQELNQHKKNLLSACSKDPCDYVKVKNILKDVFKMRDLSYYVLKATGIVKTLVSLKRHKNEKVGNMCEKMVNRWREKFKKPSSNTTDDKRNSSSGGKREEIDKNIQEKKKVVQSNQKRSDLQSFTTNDYTGKKKEGEIAKKRNIDSVTNSTPNDSNSLNTPPLKRVKIDDVNSNKKDATATITATGTLDGEQMKQIKNEEKQSNDGTMDVEDHEDINGAKQDNLIKSINNSVATATISNDTSEGKPASNMNHSKQTSSHPDVISTGNSSLNSKKVSDLDIIRYNMVESLRIVFAINSEEIMPKTIYNLEQVIYEQFDASNIQYQQTFRKVRSLLQESEVLRKSMILCQKSPSDLLRLLS